MNLMEGDLDLFGARIQPIRVMHGKAEIYGFRFGSAAYLTDLSEIPPASMERLQGLDILFLDALRHRPHPTHSTVENSLRLVEEHTSELQSPDHLVCRLLLEKKKIQ